MPRSDYGPASVARPRLDVRVRRVAGEFLVGRGEQAFALSDSAAFIWRHIDGRSTAAQISAAVAAEFGIDRDTALTDTLEMLAELAGLDLLGPTGDAA